MDKYNVWALVKGGGTTGQAEAVTLGAAKALMVFEPALKPALRRGKSISLSVGWLWIGANLDTCSWLCDQRSKARGEEEAWTC